jgi:hypothetical protein
MTVGRPISRKEALDIAHDILERAEAERYGNEMKTTLLVTIGVEWKRCVDGMPKGEPECAAVFGLDECEHRFVFETMAQARDAVDDIGLVWFAVVPWPELP